jgi:CubicO group peptidase (beta-lactamase class C family)
MAGATLPADPFAGWKSARAGAAVVERSGHVDLAGDTDAVLRIASITKLLVAYAVLVAVEEGSVDLDEAAGQPGSTVRHLLAHAGGYGFDGAAPIARPGRTRIYSNTGFELVAAHLGERTGIPMDEYVREAVLEPLGMTVTEQRGSPAHGVWSTVADLARFAGELLAPRLVSPGTVAEATSVQFPGLSGVIPGLGRQEPSDWGLGFELKDAKRPHWTGTRNAPTTFGHFGGAGTFVWVDPVAEVALVCLTDREFGPWALETWPTLSDAVLAGTTADDR